MEGRGLISSGTQTKRFFAVRGFPKSGVQWLKTLLNLHPQIDCLGEFHFQDIMQAVYQRVHSPQCYGDVADKQKSIRYFEQAIERCLVDAARPTAELIGDSTAAPLAPVVLRGVPHLVIVRDGRDVLVSRAFHFFSHPEESTLFERSPVMSRCLQRFQSNPGHFCDHPEELLSSEKLVRQTVRGWRMHLEADRKTAERNPRLVVKFVRYEDLQRELRELLPRLFEFLDVDPLQAKLPSDNELPGQPQESPATRNHKGAVGDWRKYFQTQTRVWFEEEAGDELTNHGYLEQFPW